jgi:hypothetical protein
MDASDQEQSDEQQAEEKSTEDVNEPPAITTEETIGKAQEENKASIKQNVNEKPKPKLDSSTKLFDQFTKHFHVSKIASGNTNNMLKQIQKQLTQIEKITIIRNKQQLVIGQLVSQVKVMQKQLDKVNSSINRIK